MKERAIIMQCDWKQDQGENKELLKGLRWPLNPGRGQRLREEGGEEVKAGDMTGTRLGALMGTRRKEAPSAIHSPHPGGGKQTEAGLHQEEPLS